MRPVRLELQGFGPFRAPTSVDFADAQLFAIVGPTGNGKSTLIDAICFALYGSVPRHGEREIAPIITLGAAEAKVALTFALGARELCVTRVVRRKADGIGATTKAVRLDAVRADGALDPIASGRQSEVQAAITDLLGLTFDEFTKCVVLPQGQFAAFLQATAGERTAILGALLGLTRYDRMARAARDRAGVARGTVDALNAERARLAGADTAARAAAIVRRDALAQLGDETDAILAADAILAGRIETARRELDDAEVALRAVRQVAIDDAIVARASELATARAANAEAEAIAQKLTAENVGQPSLEVLTLLLSRHDELSILDGRLANGEGVLAKARAAVEKVGIELDAARAAEEAAQIAVEGANRVHAHAELRATLVVGEPCPVCTQTVSKLPAKARTVELTRARKSLTTTRTARERVETKARDALNELTKADALAEDLRQRRLELLEQLETAPPRAEVLAMQARVRATADALELVRSSAAAVADRERALATSEDRFTAQRDELVAARLTPPASEAGPLDVRWASLQSWAEGITPELEKRAAEADAAARLATAERDAATGELRTRAEELGAESRRAALSDVITAIATATTDAAHAVARLDEAIARAKDLDIEIADVRRTELVASTLGGLLDRAHFGQWVVEEALRALVAGASGVLRQLSNDQYSLTTNTNGELLVIDHVNADETRSVRTLSGGETFQASLALALALADHVASLAPDGASALESIFLDEGFGALDPETLDTVASTIESLASAERVVGVVTHVPELAERIPVRFRVRKTGTTAAVEREET